MRDDGEDWSMWFHARDSGIDAHLAASSLGTGRVHKARSKDGLAWVADEGLGVNGCVVDVNTDEWWGFDAAHLGLGDVRLGQPDKVGAGPGPCVGGGSLAAALGARGRAMLFYPP